MTKNYYPDHFIYHFTEFICGVVLCFFFGKIPTYQKSFVHEKNKHNTVMSPVKFEVGPSSNFCVIVGSTSQTKLYPRCSMYGLFTYMKGEKWLHSRGNGLVTNIPYMEHLGYRVPKVEPLRVSHGKKQKQIGGVFLFWRSLTTPPPLQQKYSLCSWESKEPTIMPQCHVFSCQGNSWS